MANDCGSLQPGAVGVHLLAGGTNRCGAHDLVVGNHADGHIIELFGYAGDVVVVDNLGPVQLRRALALTRTGSRWGSVTPKYGNGPWWVSLPPLARVAVGSTLVG